MEPEQNSSGMSNFMESLTLESSTAEDETVALQEGSDIETETRDHFSLVSYIQNKYQRAKDKRMSDEARWLTSYRNFRGIYGPEVAFTDTEKSHAFIKITKTKVLAAVNQVTDILFSGNKFPIGVEPAHMPKELAETVHFDPKEAPQAPQAPEAKTTIARPDIASKFKPIQESLSRIQDKVKEGPGLTPSALTWEPAKIAAKRMDKKFHDQLAEADAASSLRSFVFEQCLFGQGVYKGPLAKDKEYPFWTETGEYQPKIETIADFEFVSIWDVYPDPDGRSMADIDYMVQRHRMTKTQLRALKKRPFFRSESIESAIKLGFNYEEEYWESALEDYVNKNDTHRYEVLEYWGVADADFEEMAEVKIPDNFKDRDQVQVNIWICNDQILRLVYNPFTPARIPYHSAPYELNPYSFFGIGVAENMLDTQLLMNGFMRLAVDNAILSSNFTLEVNENNLVPGQDMSLSPGKIIRTNGNLGQSVHSIKFDNYTQECLAMFDKARQLADEATGMPSYSHGQGGIQGIGRTASGMSMLMGASKENIKAVVRNIDDYLLIPLAKSLFAFNMQFEFDKEFIGDVKVVARGTESLMRNEVRSQKIMQFLQVTGNPMDAPFVKREYLLRELAESLDLEAEKSVNDVREAGIQAHLMLEMQKAQGIDPNAQKGQQNGNTPGVSDPTGTGGGNISPGMAPGPQEQGFSGGGGGNNSGGQPAKTGNGQ